MMLPDFLPPFHDLWKIVIDLIVMMIQFQQFRAINAIKRQTNGLAEVTVMAATVAGHAKGEREGREKEQARVAAQLAIFDEAAANLARINKAPE